MCTKHKICGPTQLRNWIKVYKGHKEFRNDSGSGAEIYMTKGRKTNQQNVPELWRSVLPTEKMKSAITA